MKRKERIVSERIALLISKGIAYGALRQDETYSSKQPVKKNLKQRKEF